MNPYLAIWVFLFGITVGSFLNVVIYRLPRKIKFSTGRSMCPTCRKQLRWYHNIPLFSWIFLGGKCAFCNSQISPRYPFVELLNGALYLFLYYQFGFSWWLLVFGALSSALLAICFIDYDFQIIPDSITLPGIVVGIATSLLPAGIGILESVIGVVVGGGLLYLVAEIGDRIFKKESMGGGDIKMAAMLGSFLGWKHVFLIFFGSACIGLVVSVIMMLFSAKLRRSRLIPFGPFLSIAGFIAMIYGDKIIDWYLSYGGLR
jgi:leader peptidase (prepilin peptidase)/N-methyltransferase